MPSKNLLHSLALLAPSLMVLGGSTRADLSEEWIATIPTGSSLTAGLQGMVVDAAGVSYVTGIGGPSSNTDTVTAAFAPDGSLLWSHAYNGPEDWHDQARDIALAPGGVVWVVGNTPGAGMYASVLLLKYEAATGVLLDDLQYSSAPFTSEHGQSVRTDEQGNVYVVGGTVGDGPDVLTLKFDSEGTFQWKRTWDGPASAPYSLDTGRMVRVAPDGNPIALIHGVMNSLHPDYVVVKYAADDGSTLWESTWGVSGGDSPIDMEIDAAGDVYVTGTGIDFSDKFSTIKLRGGDGDLVWQAYDSLAFRNHARALALDGQGGVLITGSIDPDGDQSNANDDFYTIKRDATDGALRWTHVYGQACVGCSDRPGDVVVTPMGSVIVTGGTSSPPYSGDMITFVLDGDSGAEADRGVIVAQSPVKVGAAVARFDATSDLFIAGQSVDYNTGAVEIAVVKYGNLSYTGENYCESSSNSQGSGAVMGANGSASITENDFTLSVSGSAANQPGLFYYGGTRLQAPFGNGVRCVGAPLFRLNPPAAADGGGSALRRVDFTAPPADSGLGRIDPGSTWNFQWWFRDPLDGGAMFNLSDGLAVTFVP